MENEYKYDVAISFAEENRDAALALSLAFEKEQLKTYYYPNDPGLGRNLNDNLKEIYLKEARYAVILLSEHYFEPSKEYTRIELEAILTRMQSEERKVYMIPVLMNKSLSLDKYPEIKALTYADWNYKPDIIAAEISKLLGKQLVNAADSVDASGLVYSSGAKTLLIVDSGVTSVNSIKNNATNIIVLEKNTEELDFERLKDTRHLCPFCGHQNKADGFGLTTCIVCSNSYTVDISKSDVEVVLYRSLNPEETHEFNKIRARIRNAIVDRDYKTAYRYCLSAEKIAPAEFTTWEHFALTEFLQEIYKEVRERKPAREILKQIKPHFEKCILNGIPDKQFDSLRVDIANRLFKLESSRINSHKAIYKDDAGYDKWTRYNLTKIKDLLYSFELCFNLYANLEFLLAYVNELAKPHKWLVRTIDGEIIPTRACGTFRAVEKFQLLVEKIKNLKPDYTPPVIEEQRFEILGFDEDEPDPDLTTVSPISLPETGSVSSPGDDTGDSIFQIISIN